MERISTYGISKFHAYPEASHTGGWVFNSTTFTDMKKDEYIYNVRKKVIIVQYVGWSVLLYSSQTRQMFHSLSNSGHRPNLK